MIEGVTILNKIPIYGFSAWIIFIFIMIPAAMIGWGIYGFITGKNKITIIVI